MTVPVLFVVHPGSACRSADDALGEDAGQDARRRLIETLREWNGGVVVIDGRLSRDMGTKRFYDLGRAIGDALRRTEAAGLPSLQIMGCDSAVDKNQVWAAREAVQRLGLTEASSVEVTGAWYDESDVFGCVNDVVRVLGSRGIDARVSDSAVRMLPDPALALTRLIGI